MLIYLDNCCFNRPFDDQTPLVIRLETEAKLFIQKEIEEGRISLVWSFILDYENNANPFPEVRKQISKWKPLASINCQLNEKISSKAASLLEKGLHNKDAAHLACAIEAKADHFLTTDKRVLNKTIPEISILNPIDFVRKYNA